MSSAALRKVVTGLSQQKVASPAVLPVRAWRIERPCFWQLSFVDRAAKVPGEPILRNAALSTNGCLSVETGLR